MPTASTGGRTGNKKAVGAYAPTAGGVSRGFYEQQAQYDEADPQEKPFNERR